MGKTPLTEMDDLDTDLQFEFCPGRYSDRQSALNTFSRAVKDTVRRNVPRTFNQEQLVYMLLELAKNTFDHSAGIGMLTLRLPSANKSLLAIYRDTGKPFDWEKWSEPGASSKKGNGTNFGLGLMVVRDGARGAGIDLSVNRSEDATVFRFERHFS